MWLYCSHWCYTNKPVLKRWNPRVLSIFSPFPFLAVLKQIPCGSRRELWDLQLYHVLLLLRVSTASGSESPGSIVNPMLFGCWQLYMCTEKEALLTLQLSWPHSSWAGLQKPTESFSCGPWPCWLGGSGMLLTWIAGTAGKGLFVSKCFRQRSVYSALKFHKSLFFKRNKC